MNRFSRRDFKLRITCSALAIVMFDQAALANCNPNPTQANTTTTCQGVTNGLVVDSDQTVVDIQSGATVTDIRVKVPDAPGTMYGVQTNTINVADGAIVSGTVGIDVLPPLDQRRVEATIENSGIITGSSGIALRASGEGSSRIASLYNAPTGVIGAVRGQVGTFLNEGLIDGGAIAAYSDPYSYQLYFGQGTVNNQGTIRSNSAEATIDLFHANISTGHVSNAGMIENLGAGAAIRGNTLLILDNEATGAIQADQIAITAPTVFLTNAGTVQAGDAAISASDAVNLVNTGRIIGDVRANATGPYPISTIDNRGGRIDGDVILGAGNDILVADLGVADAFGQISGVLDAGAGLDTIRYVASVDMVVTQAPLLPSSFERIELNLTNATTLTLSNAAQISTGLLVSGDSELSLTPKQHFINNGTIDTSGPAIVNQDFSSRQLEIANNGTIKATLAATTDWAVSIGRDTWFYNAGTITGTNGGGVSVGTGSVWTNDGSIVADGVAVSSARQFVNNGTVTSLGDIGLTLDAVGDAASENRGTIEGQLAGVSLIRAALINSGTIRASDGPAVMFTYLGASTFTNAAGGIISSTSGVAIGTDGFPSSNLRVTNAGTINGDVVMASSQFGNYPTNNVFVAAPGGILNGNLNLGSGGDVFMTSLSNDGQHPYAGVTGDVTGSGKETIRYIVDRDQTASISFGGIFSTVGYELTGNSTLTLTGSQSLTNGIHFAGTGSVDVSADIAVSDNGPAMDLTAPSYLMPMQGELPSRNALSIISRGNITQSQSSFFYNSGAVLIDSGSRFENAGTITVRNLYPYGALSAVMGSGTLVNSGTILLDGATGVSGSFFGIDPYKLEVINSGSIVQANGGAPSVGVANATALTNSGLIDVDGSAVYMTQPSYLIPAAIRNSGTIRSRTGVAISAAQASLVNEASGRIEGGPGRPVIGLNGTVDNAGTIVGDVNLYSNSSFAAAYIDRGGTLTGNLTFGDGNDLLVLNGAAAGGISGTIDGGNGTDSVVQLYTTSRTIDLATAPSLPLNFEAYGYGAVGADTTLALTGPSSGLETSLILLGDGTVVNRANVNSSGDPEARNTVRLGALPGTYGLPNQIAFVNEATLADGVEGQVRSFVNTGKIEASPSSLAVYLGTAGTPSFDFLNRGSIVGANALSLSNGDFSLPLDRATAKNDGVIDGGVYVDLFANEVHFENSGTIKGVAAQDSTSGPAMLNIGSQYYSPSSIRNVSPSSITNSGTILGGLQVRAAVEMLTFTNSGTLTAGESGMAASVAVEAPPRLFSGAPGPFDQTSVNFNNSGSIAGSARINAQTRSLTATNSGSITIAAATDPMPYDSNAALAIGVETTAAASVSFENGGSIIQNNAGHRAVDIAANSASQAHLSIKNTGSITADRGGVFLHDVFNNDPSSQVYLAAATGLNVTASRLETPATSIEIVNASGAKLSAAGAAVKGLGDNDSVPAGLENAGSVALFASADTVRIVNDGTITGRAGGEISPNIALFSLPLLTETFLAGAIQTDRSIDTVINGATGVITGSINLGANNDRLQNTGLIDGDVYLGTGDDVVILGTGARFTAMVQGGEGSDRIELATSSTYATPTELNGNRFAGFEHLINSAGVNAYSGNLALDVDVNGGYLFGRSTSVLTGNVAVASGARFGSAGTVNGNIVVASGGELAPGASPGTMIVNGNVSLNSGSTTIFELAPSGPSDHLIVNGTLAIAPGAVLNLTGDKALLPGATYDLFSATALTGRFDTITQSGAIQGVIGSSGNGISILATVAGPQSSTTQANAVIDYVNGLIASGQANPSLIAALPNLLGPDGRANAQAITRLGGEAYASAPQLAIEHGLAIVRAGRDGFAATTSAASGPFSFAEGVGAWRTLQSNTGAGTARATSNSHGAFAGFGFANQGSSIAAFIGYLDGRQNVATLDAHTDLDGVSLGVAGRANFGALSVSALFSYEWGKAGTHRTVVGNDMASDYRMYTATFDLSTNYTIALGQAWTLKPGAGLTHISTSHGQLSETGSTVFGLAVAAESFDATFIDGGVTLQRDGDTEEAIQPWIDVGVRHLLSGRRGVETIRFLDQTPTLISLGAARARTQATLTAGLAERLTDQLSFSANYTGEFGGGSGNALRAGLHYAF